MMRHKFDSVTVCAYWFMTDWKQTLPDEKVKIILLSYRDGDVVTTATESENADWWEQCRHFSEWRVTQWKEFKNSEKVSVRSVAWLERRETHETDLSDVKSAADLSNTGKAVCAADLTNPP